MYKPWFIELDAQVLKNGFPKPGDVSGGAFHERFKGI